MANYQKFFLKFSKGIAVFDTVEAESDTTQVIAGQQGDGDKRDDNDSTCPDHVKAKKKETIKLDDRLPR